MGDLFERLNARETSYEGRSHDYDDLINPDGPEAASRIAELEAKLAKAVGALEDAVVIVADAAGVMRSAKQRLPALRQALASIQGET